MNRHVGAALTVIGCLAVGCAVRPVLTTYPEEPRTQVWLSTAARRVVDSVAWLSYRLGTEQAVCVTRYRVLTTERGSVVKIDQLGPARQFWSDSVTIWVGSASDRLCDDHIPVVHTHIIPTSVWGQPSPVDSATAVNLYRAPFHIVVSVRDGRAAKLTVYAVR